MDTCIDMSPERCGQNKREREHTLKAAKVSFPIYSIPSAFKVQRAGLPGAPQKKKEEVLTSKLANLHRRRENNSTTVRKDKL